MVDLRVVRVERKATAADSLARAGLSPSPVLVLVGGAAGLPQIEEAALIDLFREHVIPAVADAGATVVDGGTDAGIMRAMGLARALSDAEFPLVGVAAEGTVSLPEDGVDEAEPRAGVDAHHSHVVLVPGREWGDESPWLSAVADALASGKPSVTLLVNGGDIAYDDVRHSLAAERPVVVLAGSGRTADVIARAVSDPLAAGGPASEIAGSPLLRPVQLQDPSLLSATLAALLSVGT